jgi:Spy/CpxP family protein refolding chaperone
MIEKLTTVTNVAVMTAGLALAQGRGGTPPDPQTMIQMRVDRLATQLTLTDAQKTQAVTIFTDAFNASQPIQSDLRSNRQSLSDAIKKNDTAAISTLSVTAGVLSGQLTAINSKAEAAFYAMLTADQQAKYDSQPHGGPGGPGGPLGPGGFGAGRFGGPRRQ